MLLQIANKALPLSPKQFPLPPSPEVQIRCSVTPQKVQRQSSLVITGTVTDIKTFEDDVITDSSPARNGSLFSSKVVGSDMSRQSKSLNEFIDFSTSLKNQHSNVFIKIGCKQFMDSCVCCRDSFTLLGSTVRRLGAPIIT
jgi:hypothetical protein